MTLAAESRLVVAPATRLRGEANLPGDKSISHRALLLGLLAEGESRIEAAGDGEDVRTTAAIIAALGAEVERGDVQNGRVDYRVRSPGLEGIVEPEGILDCQNSGTTLRLTTGILAGRPLFAVLDGDASLRRRPIRRITAPLGLMGATFAARAGGTQPPLAVTGRSPLSPIDYDVPVSSAQVKSAILLAGLQAAGTTTVREGVVTRDHTERMLRARGVDVVSEATPGGGQSVSIVGGARPLAHTEHVPGDVSAAAFWLVAGAIHPDAVISLRNVGTNPSRRAIIDLLRAMGADISETPRGDTADGFGEPLADVTIRSSDLRAIEVGPRDVAAAIDEIPVLCLAAAYASGTTWIRGAGELRHKESDRIAGIAAGLGALGALVTVDGNDICIEGGRPLSGGIVETHEDHRLVMTFAVAGLVARGSVAIIGPEAAAVSYPGFFGELERVRA